MELTRPELYLNRELSWLAFNERVLEESRDISLPLFERLKFASIFSANLDEFFMVRVAGIRQQLVLNRLETNADGMAPAEQLERISERTHALVARQYENFERELKPGLAADRKSVV